MAVGGGVVESMLDAPLPRFSGKNGYVEKGPISKQSHRNKKILRLGAPSITLKAALRARAIICLLCASSSGERSGRVGFQILTFCIRVDSAGLVRTLKLTLSCLPFFSLPSV